MTPDNNLEAEMCLLGSMFYGRRFADWALMRITAGEFFSDAHRAIFEAMRKLREESAAIDFVTVKHEMNRIGKLTSCGGVEYLIQITESVPSAGNIESYAAVVRETYTRREAARRLTEIAKLITDKVPISELQTAMMNLPEGLEGFGQWAYRMADVKIPARDRQGTSTWLPAINSKTVCGGWPAAHLNLIAALKKSGKTSFMLEDLLHQVGDPFADGHAIFVSLEMNAEQLKQRLMKMLCGMANLPEQPTIEDMQLWDQTESRIDGFNWALVYPPRRSNFVEDICRAVEAEAQPDTKIVYVDYLQKLKSRQRSKDRRFEVEEISARLSELGQDLKLPIVVGSQVNEGGGTKESTRPEEDCGLMLRLSQGPKLEIVYSRFGASGVEIPISWNAKRVRFEATQ